MNPLYLKLAQIAYDKVIETMLSGEKDHTGNEWINKSAGYHKLHAYQHAESAYIGSSKEDDTGHCLTRCAMAILKEENP
jgi:hypothetical protein